MTLMAFPSSPSDGDVSGKWVYNAAQGSWVLNEGAITLANSTTDDLAEGGANLYYTDARVQATLLDEDNMASNDATRAPTQQSTKAYVDTVTGQLSVTNFVGTAVVTEAEGLASSDNDTSFPTTAAVIDYVNNTGDITSVIAGTGLTGGATSGDATLNVSGLTTTEFAAATLVTEADAIGSNDNDTTIPTSAAVKDYVDGASVASAATLTTTRTINGTNFNGSANITTATWGTARTITLGGTAKSVNGSTNYSWTTAELGITKANIDALGIAATSATNATNINVTRDDTSNASHPLLFVQDTTAGNKPASMDNGLLYNPSTNTLTAGTFSGALSGTATNVSRSVTAGNGLTGGGTLTANITMAVGAGTGITVNANDVRVNADQRGNVTLIGANTNDYIQTGTTNHSFVLDGNVDARLFNNGEFHADGDVVAFSTSISDQRFKDQVTPVKNATETCKKLQGVEYTWNATGRKGTRDMGFIAQDVEKVIPNIVHTKTLGVGEWADNPMDAKTVDYEKLTAVLVEAVKELSARIDELESRQ